MPADVLVYTKSACPFCHRAKDLLERLGVPFREVSVDGDDALREDIRARYDWPTVPVVVIDGRCVGGFTDLAKLASTGQLGQMLGR